jgi:cationic amino acid transporter 4
VGFFSFLKNKCRHYSGAASVARAWSGYVDALTGGVIANATAGTFGEMHSGMMAKTPDFLAFFVCLAYCGLSTLGVKGSSYFNSFFTMVCCPPQHSCIKYLIYNMFTE